MYQSTTIVGHLGRNPQTRTTPNGSKVCSFSVATTRKYQRSDGTVAEETLWMTVEAWGKMGENCQKYLVKGSKVLAEGNLVVDPKTGGPRVYEKRDGGYGASFVLRARTVRFLGSKGEGNHSGYVESDDDESAYDDEELPVVSSDDIPF